MIYGNGGKVTVLVIKKHCSHFLKIAIPIGIILVIALFIAVPRQKELIITPSAHDDIEFLDISSGEFPNNIKIKFAVYDIECDCIQICVSVTNNYLELFKRKNVRIYINNNEVKNYYFVKNSSLFRDYINYVLEEPPIEGDIIFELFGKKTIIRR